MNPQSSSSASQPESSSSSSSETSDTGAFDLTAATALVRASLEDAGVKTDPEVLEAVAKEIAVKVEVQAARQVSRLFKFLPRSLGAAALEIMLLGNGGKSMRETAEELGCDASSISKAIRRAMRFVGFKIIPKKLGHTPLIESGKKL